MKTLKSLASVFAFAILISCSQTNTKPKETAKSKENQEEIAKKERPVTFFPVVIASSISIVQKIYLKKEE